MRKKFKRLIPKSTRLTAQEWIIKGLMNSLEFIEDELNTHFNQEKENNRPAQNKSHEQGSAIKHQANENTKFINQSGD